MKKNTRPNRFAPIGQVPAQPIKAGDRVMFAPKQGFWVFAAGIRTVTGYCNGFVKLSCGDVVLLASFDEIKEL